MTRYRLLSALILCSVTALPAVAASNAITAEQVAAAMSRGGLAISAQQVTLLSDVVSTTKSPTLKVESMENWGDHRMRVRLDCANHEDCLPFFVAVLLKPQEAGQSALADSGRPVVANLPTGDGSSSFVVRAGSPATLLLEGGHVHIRISVVCLENGKSGQTIRASSKDHRQTYTVKVGDDAVLRGSL
jgi:hypothetical protein